MGNVCHSFKKLKNRFGNKITDELETPIDKLSATVDLINALGSIVGIEFKNDWYFSSRSTFTLVVILVASWVFLYSVYVEYRSLTIIVLFGGLSFLVTCIVKFITVAWHHKKFMSLINFIFKVFRENVTGNKGFILSKTVDRINLHCKLVCVGVISGLLVYASYPCYDFFINGKLTLVAPMYLPFVDHTKINGYLLVSARNIFDATWGAIGCLVFSFVFLICVDVYDGLVDLVEADLRVFDSMCEKNDQVNISKRSDAFRNITLQLMDLVRYVAYMNELFSMTATVQIVACNNGMVTLLFSYLVNNYVSGIGASAYYFTELMMFCSIGQLLDLTSERITSVICNSKWYTYDTKYQKDMIFVLATFQNVSPIRIANLYPLNFETGLQIINNIYSMVMVMLNVLG